MTGLVHSHLSVQRDDNDVSRKVIVVAGKPEAAPNDKGEIVM